MAYTINATERRGATGLVLGKGEAGSVKCLAAVATVATGATGRTVYFGKIPSNARLLGISKVYAEDLASTGAPIFDFGLGGDQITDDADALGNGVATVATAGTYNLITDFSDIGKQAWEFVNAQTTDPGGALDVYGTLTDAVTTIEADLGVEVYYMLD